MCYFFNFKPRSYEKQYLRINGFIRYFPSIKAKNKTKKNSSEKKTNIAGQGCGSVTPLAWHLQPRV
jgi:hypothetical protein